MLRFVRALFLTLALVPGFALAQSGTGGALSAPEAEDGMTSTEAAKLRWLDKITGRIDNFTALVGETTRVGTLEIIVRACKRNPPEETPESAAFLDVWEIKPGEPAVEVFRGWMFASSPALNAMEHPVYDVWVLGCVDAPKSTSSSSTPAQENAAGR